MIIIDLIIVIISLTLLALISERTIRYASMLAELFGMSQMAVGFIILSISTSLPELTVSVIASIGGEGGLSFGNVMGSNIANLTIILGLAIIFSRKRILIKEESQKELVQILFIASIIPLFIIQRGSLSPVLGIVLLILFGYFSFNLSRKKSPEVKSLIPVKLSQKVTTLVKFFITIVFIIIISNFTVSSSINIAYFLDLPPSLIGATIIGLGTSLPELSTTIQALKQNKVEMALGNILGSCITNITLILGVSSVFNFYPVNITAAGGLIFFTLLSTMLIWYVINTKKLINKRIAYFLLLIYAFFILQELGFSLFIF
ncbi:MAG: sodium:calcium antiporter [Promethearchaeia archaeon]